MAPAGRAQTLRVRPWTMGRRAREMKGVPHGIFKQEWSVPCHSNCICMPSLTFALALLCIFGICRLCWFDSTYMYPSRLVGFKATQLFVWLTRQIVSSPAHWLLGIGLVLQGFLLGSASYPLVIPLHGIVVTAGLLSIGLVPGFYMRFFWFLCLPIGHAFV